MSVLGNRISIDPVKFDSFNKRYIISLNLNSFLNLHDEVNAVVFKQTWRYRATIAHQFLDVAEIEQFGQSFANDMNHLTRGVWVSLVSHSITRLKIRDSPEFTKLIRFLQ